MPASQRRTVHLKTAVQLLAVISLIAAYLVGFWLRQINEQALLKKQLPAATSLKEISRDPLIFEGNVGGENPGPCFISVEKASGYGGPVTVGTEVDASGTIRRVLVMDHNETPAFMKKIRDHRFLDQYSGKSVSAHLYLNSDIDSVTGATVSSKAIAKCVRRGAHAIGKDLMNLPIPDEKRKIEFGFQEGVLIALYALVLIGVLRKITILRYVTLASGVIFLGFYMNSAISLANIASILLGHVPPITEKAFWWLLIMGTLAIILVHGKNLYCYWLCPFGALQEFATKIGGMNVQLEKRLMKYAQYVAYFLTWLALMLIFVTSKSSIGSFEPFATVFGLEGIGVQWYLMPTVILGSFFLARFWCRFFCPVGVVLRLTTRVRHRLKRIIRGDRTWQSNEASSAQSSVA